MQSLQLPKSQNIAQLRARGKALPCVPNAAANKLQHKIRAFRTTAPRIAFTNQRVSEKHTSTHNVIAAAGNGASTHTCALIFDCDGVIVETEELHRQAYNAAFEAFGLAINGTPLEWTVEYYDVLQNTVGGGKPKMRYHFTNNGWPTTSSGPVPTTEEEQTALVDALQDKKTDVYKVLADTVASPRPGVVELMDAAIARPDIAVCICSAATTAGFVKLVNAVLGPERLSKFDVIMSGDDVSKKKPDPMIYNTARERLGLDADKCLVIEDSMVGLRAATAAGMHCIITPTTSTVDAPFCQEGAMAVVPALAGDLYTIGVEDLFVTVNGVTVPNVTPELEGDMCAVDWNMSANPFASTMTA